VGDTNSVGPLEELTSITGQLQLYTCDQSVSIGDNRKMYNKNCDNACTTEKDMANKCNNPNQQTDYIITNAYE
jgi:hypothetical protein